MTQDLYPVLVVTLDFGSNQFQKADFNQILVGVEIFLRLRKLPIIQFL